VLLIWVRVLAGADRDVLPALQEHIETSILASLGRSRAITSVELTERSPKGFRLINIRPLLPLLPVPPIFPDGGRMAGSLRTISIACCCLRHKSSKEIFLGSLREAVENPGILLREESLGMLANKVS